MLMVDYLGQLQHPAILLLTLDLSMDLCRLCPVSHIKRSYCPHHGALDRLNFWIILSLLKKP